jgi:hypothetical protein
MGEKPGAEKPISVSGLALSAHKRSLLLRRINKDAVKIKPRIERRELVWSAPKHSA